MRYLLAPESCHWLPAVVERLPLTAGDQLLAPWALTRSAPSWLGPQLQAAWARRCAHVPSGVERLTVPGWSALEAGLRVTGRGSALRYRQRFGLRQLLSRIAAARLSKQVETVVAPSLAARELFAAARARGARCILVEDLPSLRELHDDLERAASRHPQATFLRHHRATAAQLARQEAERVLADELWVRGPFTAALLQRAGYDTGRIQPLRASPPPTSVRAPQGRTLQLAGGATARAGIYEALAALDARPQWTLRVRDSEATEPAARRHPRVRFIPAQADLHAVDAVLAPAWCEQHADESEAAGREGVPLIATDRAAGWRPCLRVPMGSPEAIVRALDALECTDGTSDYSR